MRIPVAPGVALHARHWPGDDTYLLVHGLASNARMWDDVAALLSAAGHGVVAVDQRGHGRSDKPDVGYDFPTLTNDLVAVLDALALDTVVAAGQSWGANVVLELGDRWPARVRGVACIDGGAIDMQTRLPAWDEAAKLLAPPPLTGAHFAEIDAGIRRMHSDWPEAGIQGSLANFERREDGTLAPWLSRARHMVILRGLWEHHPSALSPSMPVLFIAARDHDAHHDIHAQKPELVGRLLLEKFG